MERSNLHPADWSITGPDFLQLIRADAPAGGLSDWLAQHLRGAISDGRLPVGSRLPATRVLAGELHVSRGVVTEAYQRLIEEGQLAGCGRAGTRVVAAPLTVPDADQGAGMGTWPADPGAAPAADRAVFGAAPGTGVFDALRAARCRIDLSPGVPDRAAFPRTACPRADRARLGGLSPPS